MRRRIQRLKLAPRFEGDVFGRLRMSEDFKEGVEAFHGKRKAVFRGV